LGVRYDASVAHEAITQRRRFVDARQTDAAEVARLLHDGKIIARCAGRAEFGPRALGGRSLLASPCLETSKSRLNRIKGRQPWRPVAPIVAHARLSSFMDGPSDSFWMTFSHRIHDAYRERLPALAHPDQSTRAQTLLPEQDPWLYEVLCEFERLSGFPILVNTSLNGPGEPILETPAQALDWYLQASDVDLLLLDEAAVQRRAPAKVLAQARLQLDPATVVSFQATDSERAILVREHKAIRISAQLTKHVLAFSEPFAVDELFEDSAPSMQQELYGLLVHGLLRPAAVEDSDEQALVDGDAAHAPARNRAVLEAVQLRDL
jgi:carbamoyltransferase